MRVMIVAGSLVAGVVCAGSLWWALRPVEPRPVILPAMPLPSGAGASLLPITPALWSRTLWQPLVEPPPPTVQPTPQRLRLLAIITDDDHRTYALIDPQDEWGPLRLGVGEEARGIALTTVHERAVSVTDHGRIIRLELDP